MMDDSVSVTFWEELNANSWPPFKQLPYDGWLLRFTQGYSLHNNSVWPLYSGPNLVMTTAAAEAPGAGVDEYDYAYFSRRI